MEYRRLGNSDLELPAICFGAWAIGGWMWGGTDDAAAIRAIQHAVDVGITCVDTAPIYGFGHSEEVVGKAIADRRERVIVATKCGLRWDLEEGQFFFESTRDGKPCRIYRNLKAHSIKHEIDQSLRRLCTDVIDLYQCHWPDNTTDLDETMEALLEVQRAGKIRAIGVSNFTPEMMDQCLAKGALASDQPKYNLLHRDIERDVLPYCVEHDVGVLAYSPIAQGLLTGKVTLEREFDPDDQRSRNPWFSRKSRERVLDMLDKFRPIAAGHGATLAQIAANWVISQKGVTSALVGARNEAQVEENAGAADFKLTGEELTTMRQLAERLEPPA